jgi:glucokinase
MKYGFGVDIGGTTVKIGYLSDEGKLLDKWEIPTDRSGNGENILGDVAAAVKNYISEKNIPAADIIGIGLGVPGPVTTGGVVNKCANLGWGVINVEEELSKLTGLPVKAGNDANVAALGEMWQGGGKGHDSVVMVTLGTGVGGGIIVDGKIVAGANGAGGEIGHISVNHDETETCGCGKKGCLEQYTSATGIVRNAKNKLASSDKATEMRKFADISAKDIFDCAKAGDEMALEVIDDFGRILGETLAHIACVCDPEVFVIGGGVSKAGKIILDAVEKYYKQYAFHASRSTGFALATLDNDAGMYGSFRQLL